jgi:hypothetical protein
MRALIAMLTVVAMGCDVYTDDLGDGGASLVRDTAAAEAMCRDELTCDELWGANVDGCRAYLDTCLSGLTNDQRDQWNAAVTQCLATTTTCADRFACYAIAPRC